MSLNSSQGDNVTQSPSAASENLTFRQRAYAVLLDPHIEDNMHKSIEKWIGILIVANLIALLVENIEVVYAPNKTLFHAFDVFSLVVFTIEYLLRFYTAPEDDEFKGSSLPRFAYFRSPFALIDLIAILPFYLSAFVSLDLRMLRALRLLRMLRGTPGCQLDG